MLKWYTYKYNYELSITLTTKFNHLVGIIISSKTSSECHFTDQDQQKVERVAPP